MTSTVTNQSDPTGMDQDPITSPSGLPPLLTLTAGTLLNWLRGYRSDKEEHRAKPGSYTNSHMSASCNNALWDRSDLNWTPRLYHSTDTTVFALGEVSMLLGNSGRRKLVLAQL